MTYRAIAVNPQHPEQFMEFTAPLPMPGPNDVLVEIRAIALNPIDTKIRAVLQSTPPETPRILGWDACGVVLQTGSQVTGFKAGEEVWYAGELTRNGTNATHQLVDYRLMAHKPHNLTVAQAAAMPLTALTAWEGLFEKLSIQNARSEKTLLILGGAGGVGSLAIPLAKKHSDVKVIATASRPDSAQWCQELGADLVVDYRDLKAELSQAGIQHIDYIFCLNDTDAYWPVLSELVAPFGHICSIVANTAPLDMGVIRNKSASLHWELMYTRSLYQTADMSEQSRILQRIAQMVEQGELHSTLKLHWQGLTIENIEAGHQQILGGHTHGKLVIEL